MRISVLPASKKIAEAHGATRKENCLGDVAVTDSTRHTHA